MGVIMGTAAYMSPEQASGEATDKRSDIWSFGVVLFEMLTGQRLFSGKTVSHVLGAVLQVEPTWDTLPTSVPQPLRKLLRRCLEKDRKRRLRDIGDALTDLDEALTAQPADETAHAGVAQPAGWRQALPLALGISAVAVIIMGLAVWSLMRPGTPAQPTTRFTVTLPASDQLALSALHLSMALSPDGETLVYAATRDGVRQLYRRSLTQLEAVLIPGTEGARQPFFSPDGAWLGFELNGTLMKLALAGGPPATVYDGAIDASDASWGSNDTIVFSLSTDGHPIMQVPAAGGAAEPVTALADGELDHRTPQLLPGGTALLFVVAAGAASDRTSQIVVESLNTGERQSLLDGTSPRYVSTGHIVFARENSLWAVPFDAGRLELTGDAVPVLEDVVVGFTGFAQFTVATNGTLVYVRGTLAPPTARTLVWVDREGREESVTAPPRAYQYLDISPDGTRTAVSLQDQERDVWIWDFGRETLTRLTFDPGIDSFPVWTPDGRRVVFASTRGGEGPNLFWRLADGTGDVERLTESATGRQFPQAFSPDGTRLVLQEQVTDTGRDLVMLALEGERAATGLRRTEFSEQSADVSPDGNWLAYDSDASGQFEVYVRPFPDVDTGQWQVSTDGGFKPVWAPGGGELFYLAPGGRMMAVTVQSDGTFAPGNPEVLFEGSYLPGTTGRAYDISPSGDRFLMIKRLADDSAEPEITLVQNWFQELTERVPVP